MLDALTITEDEAAGLSRLAAEDLAMALDFAARAKAAEDPETANDFARSYQRMARSYRQSLALKVRLAREIARAERDAPPPPRDEARIQARMDDLRGPVRRVIWAEREAPDPIDDDCDEIFGVLDEHLDLICLDDRFGLDPLDVHVVAVCRTLGFDSGLARRWRELPDPPGEIFEPEPVAEPKAEPDPDAYWRGSG